LRALTRPSAIEHHGVWLPLSGAVSAEMRAVLYSGAYEEREYEVLSQLLVPTDRVLELGSGLGFITVVCAQRCSSVSTVEANPRMLDTLRDTFRRNGVSPRLVSGMVSSSGEDQTLFVARDFWSSSAYDRGGTATRVAGLGFARLLEEHQPTVLVIDIEGAEVGLTCELIASGVRAVVIELHGSVTGTEGARRVRDWLSGQGFQATRDWGDRSVVVYERPAALTRAVP
jgi:FkbM family methyltransferase